MQARFNKGDGAIFLLALVGLAVFLFLYPRLFPEAALRMEVAKEEIVEMGTAFVEELGYTLEDYHRVVRLEHDADQLRYLERAFGSFKANGLMADSISVFHWSLRWSSEKVSPMIGGGEKELEEQLERLFGDIRLSVDLRGEPIGFEFKTKKEEEVRPVEGSVASEEVDRSVAEGFAKKMLGMYGGDWSFEGGIEKPGSTGTVHQYAWKLRHKVAGEEATLRVSVRGGLVQSFRKAFTIPEPYVQKKEGEDWGGVGVVILFLLFFILVVIYFIKRLRSDLIDLKSGLIFGVLVLLGWLVTYWTQTSSASGEPSWAMMLGFVLTAPFVGGGIWALFSVGESLTREVWAEKLTTLDTLRRKILFPGLGLTLFRGVALVFLGLGVISILDYLGVTVFHGHYSLGDEPLHFWTSRWPSLYVVGKSLLSPLYIVVTFCLFLMTVLRRRLKKVIWVLPILFLLWSWVSVPIPRLEPFLLRMGINGLVGLLFAVFFLRYDFITVATGGVGLPILFYGVAALGVGSGVFTVHGGILIGLLGMILLLAFFACRGEEPSGEVVPYVPDYLQRIYEKERIQRELEIARNVQLTFLPRRNPEIQGMDIASLCVPAKEVGGDYYDFVEMGPRKLGVVIGDVSGKGISAAFYMTLTKGFLKSQARGLLSPREVLVNMNELFYENAERGIFVSMMYGIFDLDGGTLTFARAGHNPMILRHFGKGEAEELTPPGIALGLERGDVFDKTIEERTILIAKNDVFLFYTDGLNEAQNRMQEEFGEDRLIRLVDAFNELSSEDLLRRIQQEIQGFTGETSQHDDMTAVVVKIL